MNTSRENKTPDSKKLSFFHQFKNSLRQCSTPFSKQPNSNSLLDNDLSSIEEEGYSISNVRNDETVIKLDSDVLADVKVNSLINFNCVDNHLNKEVEDGDLSSSNCGLFETIKENLPPKNEPAVLMPSKDGPFELMPSKEEPLELMPSKGGPLEVMPSEDDPPELMPSKGGPLEVMPSEYDPPELMPCKGGPLEVMPSEDDPPELMPSKGGPLELIPPEEEPLALMPSKDEPLVNLMVPIDDSVVDLLPFSDEPLDLSLKSKVESLSNSFVTIDYTKGDSSTPSKISSCTVTQKPDFESCDKTLTPGCSQLKDDSNNNTLKMPTSLSPPSIPSGSTSRKRKHSNEDDLNLNPAQKKTNLDPQIDDDSDELACTVVDEMSITFDKKLEVLDPEVTLKESSKIVSAAIPLLDLSFISDEKCITEANKRSLEKSVLNFAHPPPLKEFLSDDPKENKDNFDPKWNNWKSLTTDEQRYKALQEVWRNQQIPDPRNNLTTYNWRAKNNLPKINFNIPNSKNNYSNLKAGTLNDIFLKYRNSVKALHNSKRNNLENWFSQKINAVKSKGQQALSRSHYQYHSAIFNEMNNEISTLRCFYNQKVGLLDQQYAEREHRLITSQKEVHTVYSFYKGLNGNNGSDALKFSPTELRQWYELDDIISKYEDIYQ